MSINVLADEISTDPLARGYATMSDNEVAADLNTAYRPTSRIATIADVQAYLITQINGTGINQRSAIGMIQEFAEQGTVRGVVPAVGVTAVDARRSACQMIWYMLRYAVPDAGFPVGNANIQAQFISIGPDGGSGPSVLTATHLAEIAAMASGLNSRAKELGLERVESREVRWARLEIV